MSNLIHKIKCCCCPIAKKEHHTVAVCSHQHENKINGSHYWKDVTCLYCLKKLPQHLKPIGDK